MARLHRERRIFNLASALAWAAGAAMVWAAWGGAAAGRWAILPALALIYQSRVLLRHLEDNVRPGEDVLLPSLGWGNRLSLLRAVLIAGMMGFLLLPKPAPFTLLSWTPGILYTLACAADFFDGYIARVTDHATRLGGVLDMSFDGLGVLAAGLLAVHYGQVPAWYVLVAAARYAYLLGMRLRQRLHLENYPLPPRLERRIFAGLQMGFLAVALLPLFAPPATTIAAFLFGGPLLAGFTRDWLYTAGVLRAQPDGPGSASTWAARLAAALAVALRLGAIAIALVGGGWAINRALGMPAAYGLGWEILHGGLLLLILLGVTPRLSAIAGLVVLGFYQSYGPLLPAHIALAVIYTLILYFGGGRWSLYAPEETLFQRPAGGAPRTTTRVGG